jgi:hypothetical protein
VNNACWVRQPKTFLRLTSCIYWHGITGHPQLHKHDSDVFHIQVPGQRTAIDRTRRALGDNCLVNGRRCRSWRRESHKNRHIKLIKILPNYQPCQLVKYHRRFRNHLSRSMQWFYHCSNDGHDRKIHRLSGGGITLAKTIRLWRAFHYSLLKLNLIANLILHDSTNHEYRFLLQ